MNTIVSQALAVGLPVITTRHSGLPEQVTDGQNGFLVDEGDYAALAERIIDLVEHPELIHTFSKHAREHVAQRYDAASLAERQIDAYREVAFGVRTTPPEPVPSGGAQPARCLRRLGYGCRHVLASIRGRSRSRGTLP